MRKGAQETINLNEVQEIWIRPNEDLLMEFTFDADMTGSSFSLRYEEFRWSYSSGSNAEMSPGYMTDVFTLSEDVLSIEIPYENMSGWENKRVSFSLIVDDSWVAVDGSIHIEYGR